MKDDLLRLRDHAQRGEPVFDFETTRRRKDGALLRVAITASPIRDGDELSGMSVIARDITDRKQAEEALRSAPLRIQAKFENAAVGMADVSIDGVWLRVNGKLCSMLGYTHAELMRTTFADITHPEDLADDLAHVQRLVSGGPTAIRWRNAISRKDGSIVWANLTVGVVRRPDGAFDHFLSIVQDISERKLAEERVRLLMNEVNHRANNLLAVVQSIAQQTAGSGTRRPMSPTCATASRALPQASACWSKTNGAAPTCANWSARSLRCSPTSSAIASRSADRARG